MTAPAFPEAAGAELGEYEVGNFDRWNLFAPRRGQVITTELPGEVYGQEGIEAAFVVLSRELAADGSLTLHVRALGSTNPEAMSWLSSTFNRRAGSIHICLNAGPCLVEGSAFHVHKLELWDGSTFPEHRMSPSGRRILKKILEGQDDGMDEPEMVDVGPPEERKSALKPPKGTTKRATGPKATRGKGLGDGAKARRSAGPHVEAGGGAPAETAGMDALRGRLEKIKRKQQEAAIGGLGGTDGGRLDDEEDGDAEPVQERLRTSTKLGLTHARAGPSRALVSMAPGGGPKDGISRPSSEKLSKKGVASCLALQAAAARGRKDKKKKRRGKKDKALSALQTLLGGKRKRKKKKKDDKDGGGDPGGSDDSTGDDSSYSSDREKDSSGDETKLLPPLKMKSDREEGSVLALLVEQVEERLNELGTGGESSVPLLHGTKLVTYWHNLIQSNTVNQQSRDGRELYLLANCIDLLRVGRLARLGDALAARWLALEQASLDQGWSAARHLELYSPEHQTAAGSAVTLAARKFGRLMEKVTAADDKKGKGSNRPRGKGDQGWQRAEPWQEKNKGKGKKGKPKENAWSGRGAWKNQQWGWQKQGNKEQDQTDEKGKAKEA